MANNRYQLSGKRSDAITARLLYVSSALYEGDWTSILHTHYFAELFYVRSGRGSFIVEDTTFPVKQDDLVIINPNVEHTEVSNGADPLEYVVLGVEGLCFSFSGSQETKNFHVYNYKTQRDELLFYFKAMLREIEQKEYNYEMVCQDLLEVLIVNLMRSTDYSFSVVPTQKASKECSQIKRHLDTHFSDNLTLDDLAKIAHLNKYYLAHTFSKYYGMSPISYLIDKRIQVSRELLESTNYSVAQIGQAAGFSSQSYFSQSFKKVCGMTPADYRKMMKRKE